MAASAWHGLDARLLGAADQGSNLRRVICVGDEQRQLVEPDVGGMSVERWFLGRANKASHSLDRLADTSIRVGLIFWRHNSRIRSLAKDAGHTVAKAASLA